MRFPVACVMTSSNNLCSLLARMYFSWTNTNKFKEVKRKLQFAPSKIHSMHFVRLKVSVLRRKIIWIVWQWAKTHYSRNFECLKCIHYKNNTLMKEISSFDQSKTFQQKCQTFTTAVWNNDRYLHREVWRRWNEKLFLNSWFVCF